MCLTLALSIMSRRGKIITIEELNSTSADVAIRNALVIAIDSFNTWIRDIVGRGQERSRSETLGAFVNRLKKELYALNVIEPFASHNIGDFEIDCNVMKLCKLNFIYGRFAPEYSKLVFAKLNSFVPSVIASIPTITAATTTVKAETSSYDDIFNNFHNQLKSIFAS